MREEYIFEIIRRERGLTSKRKEQIIRCIDCEYYDMEDKGCDKLCLKMKPDDYCSFALRKGDRK